MSSDSFKVKNSLNIDPKASPTLDQNGDIAVDSSTNKLKVRLNGTTENVASEAYVDAHINDATAAHAASAIAFTPAGTIAATDAQTAIEEVATDAASALSTHESDTTNIHGIVNTADLNLKSTLTTKGDIYVATGASTISRKGVGADNTYLKSNSAQADGLEWASIAGAALAVTTKTTTYTATTADDVILATSGSAWTLTLYAASGNSGKILTIKKTSSDFNAITIDGNGSETIDGQTTTTINTQYECLKIICDGSNWHILERKIDNSWIAFTPTGNFTNCTYTGFYRRVADTMELDVKMLMTGTPGSATNLINIPFSLAMDTAKMTYPTSERPVLGWAKNLRSGTGDYHGQVTYLNSTQVGLELTTVDALTTGITRQVGASTNSNPYSVVINDTFHWRFLVPISGWKGN